MDRKSTKPRNILLDIQQELQGLLLEDTFTIYNHEYTLRLLNEQETIWTYGFLNPKSTISIAVASRLASLAIGMRAIDGMPVSEAFEDTYNALSQAEQDEIHKEHKKPQMVYASLVMDWLSDQPDIFVNGLHEAWQALERRRIGAQTEVKNSSGESLEKEENPNLTELSQLGEQLPTGSE